MVRRGLQPSMLDLRSDFTMLDRRSDFTMLDRRSDFTVLVHRWTLQKLGYILYITLYQELTTQQKSYLLKRRWNRMDVKWTQNEWERAGTVVVCFDVFVSPDISFQPLSSLFFIFIQDGPLLLWKNLVHTKTIPTTAFCYLNEMVRVSAHISAFV